jgi:hypothetical protein
MKPSATERLAEITTVINPPRVLRAGVATVAVVVAEEDLVAAETVTAGQV